MIIKYTLILFFVFITSCSSNKTIVSNPITGKKSNPGIFSKDADKGISLTDILGKNENENTYININAYLWKASLNVLSVAPLISTDALGGTIITDWYVNKNIKNKRIKIMAYIKTSELRSDGISVKVHVQKLENGFWTDTYTDNYLASEIENNILNEARNNRINTISK